MPSVTKGRYVCFVNTATPTAPVSEQQDKFPLLDLFQGHDHSASRLVLSTLRTAALLDRVVARSLAPYHLHHAQFNALMLLRRRGEHGLRPSILGDYLCVSRPNVTKLLARLKSRMLIEERPDPDDGRAVLALVTPAGAEMAERAAQTLSQDLRRVVAMLACSQGNALCGLLDQFRNGLANELSNDGAVAELFLASARAMDSDATARDSD